jgi:hypothetical protein
LLQPPTAALGLQQLPKYINEPRNQENAASSCHREPATLLGQGKREHASEDRLLVRLFNHNFVLTVRFPF